MMITTPDEVDEQTVIGKENKLRNAMHILFVAPLVLMLIGCSRKDLESHKGFKEPIADSVYLREGDRIVALTFDTLRKSLLQAIGSQDMDGAITFCNDQAYPITALYSDSVVVRRTALRFRNPGNRPDSLERFILHAMREQMKTLKEPGTKIIRSDSTEEIHFFKPILMQPLCLNCHGTPGKQIRNATFAKIQQLYPNDQAVDYKEGDLRGAWHVIFNPQERRPVIKN